MTQIVSDLIGFFLFLVDSDKLRINLSFICINAQFLLQILFLSSLKPKQWKCLRHCSFFSKRRSEWKRGLEIFRRIRWQKTEEILILPWSFKDILQFEIFPRNSDYWFLQFGLLSLRILWSAGMQVKAVFGSVVQHHELCSYQTTIR
jgi:hypothetical protein